MGVSINKIPQPIAVPETEWEEEIQESLLKFSKDSSDFARDNLYANAITITEDATLGIHTVINIDATSGDVTATLPPLSKAQYKVYWIKRVDGSGNTVTIAGDSTETVDGETTITLSQYEGKSLSPNNDEWGIISDIAAAAEPAIPDTTLNATDDGIVNMPLQSGCTAEVDGFQTITTGTTTIVQFSLEIEDVQGEFNTTTYRFTATEDGAYYVKALLSWSLGADGKLYEHYIFVNGSMVRTEYLVSYGARSISGPVSDRLILDAGDYLEIKVRHNVGSDARLYGAFSGLYTSLTVSKIA